MSPARIRRRSKPLFAGGVLGVAIVALIVLVFVMSGNIVYFKTVSEAVADREADADRRIRMAGTVVPGSIAEQARRTVFELTEGGVTVPLTHRGGTPDLFEECAPLVVEGRWHDGQGIMAFESDRILVRHDNEYRAPDDDVPDCD